MPKRSLRSMKNWCFMGNPKQLLSQKNVVSIYFAQCPTGFKVYTEKLFSTFRARVDLHVCVFFEFVTQDSSTKYRWRIFRLFEISLHSITPSTLTSKINININEIIFMHTIDWTKIINFNLSLYVFYILMIKSNPSSSIIRLVCWSKDSAQLNSLSVKIRFQ